MDEWLSEQYSFPFSCCTGIRDFFVLYYIICDYDCFRKGVNNLLH